MSAAFQHMMTLLSFVLAIGVSHQLFTVVEIFRARSRVRLSWVHAIWMGNCFLAVICWWIGMWDFHAIPAWPVPSILYNVTAMICVFLAIAFACPKVPDEGTLDLWQFHLDHRNQYVAFTIAELLLATGDGLYYGNVYGVARQGIQNVIIIGAALAAAVALFTPNLRVQQFAAVAVNTLLLVFLFVGDPVLA